MVDDDLIFGWAAISTADGQPCFDDRHGTHMPAHALTKAAMQFMEGERPVRVEHRGEPIGEVIFAWPMTEEIAKAMGVRCNKTGLLVGIRPDDPAMLDRFQSGALRGFSLGTKVTKMDDTVVDEKQKRKRRKMLEFELLEISCVDRPAQAGALATLMKRDGRFLKYELPLTEQERYEAALDRLSKGEHDRPKQASLKDDFEDDDTEDDDADELKPSVKKEDVMSYSDFDEAVREIALTEKVSRCEAMSRARDRHPQLFAKFQREGVEAVAKAAESTVLRPDPVVDRFEGLVTTIAKRENCTRVQAMQRARERDPALFQAYRAA